MPKGFETVRIAVKPEPRPEAKPVERMLAAEAARVRERVPKGATLVVLDERGRDLDTRGLSTKLRGWLDEGAPVAFVVGSADGIDPGLKRSAALQLRLSSFTLPHALAQVLVCEQLYRAASLLLGHPYHRD
jgi:23S rRNA (pseudouridine1915-N3)-methyltransferase